MNKYGKVAISALTILTASVWGIPDASATVLGTVDMNYLFAGETPASPTGGAGTPWLTAQVSSTGNTETSGQTTLYQYSMTMTSYLSSGEFVGGVNKSIGWAFSFGGSVSGFADGTPSTNQANFVCVNGAVGVSDVANPSVGDACTINVGPTSSLTPAVPWNVAFYWGNNVSSFTDGQQATYTFYSTIDPSAYGTSFFGYTNTDGLYSMAHVQGIVNNGGAGGTCSVWIANGGASGSQGTVPCGNSTAVPEPSELPLMALGLSLIAGGLFARKKRRI